MRLTLDALKPFAVTALAALALSWLGAAITDIGPWYRALLKPEWQPPDWLFGPVWTAIFALAAVSAATAWRAAPSPEAREWVIALFIANGFLNVLWSLLFFRLRRPDWALAEVMLLWLSILMLILVLAPISRLASRLLWPYLAWVSFAALLNWRLVSLNAPFEG